MEEGAEESRESGSSGSQNEGLIHQSEESRESGPSGLLKEGNIEYYHHKSSVSDDDINQMLWKVYSEEEPSRVKCESVEDLPENFQILLEIFGQMVSASNIHSISHRTPTFQLLSNAVERMCGRKFLHKHLAQMKYLLPEVLQLEKINIHNEKTECMVPELKISFLRRDEADLSKEDYICDIYHLKSLFSSKLMRFYRSNPEATDVPEADLPFNQRSSTVQEDLVSNDLQAAPDPGTFDRTEVYGPSHFPPNFKPYFCERSKKE